MSCHVKKLWILHENTVRPGCCCCWKGIGEILMIAIIVDGHGGEFLKNDWKELIAALVLKMLRDIMVLNVYLYHISSIHIRQCLNRTGNGVMLGSYW